MKTKYTQKKSCQLNYLSKIIRLIFKTSLLTGIFLISAHTFAQKISAGWSHSLYLCAVDSTANGWGANSFGQTGNGSTSDIYLAEPVNNLNNINIS